MSEEAVVLYQPLILPLSISILGLLLIAVGAHSETVTEVEAEVAEPVPEPDPRERVVNWVQEFRRRHGRNPRIPEVQKQFNLPKTTAWRAANR